MADNEFTIGKLKITVIPIANVGTLVVKMLLILFVSFAGYLVGKYF